MNTVELGRRIREARLSKKLTQSEVVGDFITRNMLSQIESGTATPSMKTLTYLSQTLDIPISVLVPSDEDADALSELLYTKHALGEERFEDAVKLAQCLVPELEDEANALLARAHLALARKCVEAKAYTDAVAHARMAIEKAQHGVYASKEIRSEALLLIDETTGVT